MTYMTLPARKSSYTLRVYEALSRPFARASEIEETRRALSALSDDMLKDIGVERHDIETIARRRAV